MKTISEKLLLEILDLASQEKLQKRLAKLKEETEELMEALAFFDEGNKESINHLVDELVDYCITAMVVIVMTNSRHRAHQKVIDAFTKIINA